MGNFFSMLVMGMFAVFWLSFGVLQTPSWGIAASYSATGDAAEGAASVGYNAAIALYLTMWGFWLFTTFIFTLKTNTVFALIFLCAFISSFIFAGAYYKVSTKEYDMALKLQKVSESIQLLWELVLIKPGWRSYILRIGRSWILHHSRDDSSGDENDCQASRWRPLALLAEV